VATSRILIIDSDHDRAADVASRAKSDAWDTVLALGASGGCAALADPNPASLVLVDASLWHDKNTLRDYIAQKHPSLPVIVLTDRDATPDSVIEQLHLGAMTYVPRDAASRRLVETVQTILSLAGRNPYRERVREFLRAGAVELHIANDTALIPLVVGYTQRILEDYGLTAEIEQTRLGVALSEALSNAMIHGNLDISSDLRDTSTDTYYDLITTRRAREPYVSRQVQVQMRFSQSSLTVVIRDQGKGFDRSALTDPTDPENIERLSGRGVLLMRAYTDALSWNDSGNEVTLTKVLKT
jgi:anti-sigma regulatory factor (Ser/Thr protein kinase)